jgi:hypothetical protein
MTKKTPADSRHLTFELKGGEQFGIRPNQMRVVSQAGADERGIRPNQSAPPPPPPPPTSDS